MIAPGAGGPPGGHSVANLVERFVDNRRRRQQTIDAHLDEVEDALAQGDPVKFAFWSLDQDPTFFASAGPAPQMLEVLGREIGLTAEQMARLNAHRPAIREDRETLSRCRQLLRDAREHIHHHIHRSSLIMEQIRRILNPVQVCVCCVSAPHAYTSISSPFFFSFALISLTSHPNPFRSCA